MMQRDLGRHSSREKIFQCHPSGAEDQEGCARKILSALAHRAYRRPVTNEEVEVLMGFYDAGWSKGGFEEGIRMALERILVSMQFLFRIEQDPPKVSPGAVYRISDLELASLTIVLSLDQFARRSTSRYGRERQAERPGDAGKAGTTDARYIPAPMLLSATFFGQWLQLRHVEALSPDRSDFPDFDGNLREAFQQETELFLQSMLREDRPLMELLDANYTFLNERLARHYGIPNIYGSSFRRVTLTDENRRGLLGQGSVLPSVMPPERRWCCVAFGC